MPELPPLLSPPVEAMRQPVIEGTTRPLAWRLEQLSRIESLLQSVETDLLAALTNDLGKPPLEAYFELVGVREELQFTRRHVKRWLAGRRIPLPAWSWPARSRVQPEPLGCVLIFGAWNYPFQLCLQPVISALAAGNTVVLKPSELAPHTASLIADRLSQLFPPEWLQVVQGDGQVGAQLLETRFDHIFFTGGSRVGRLVMAAAARHLTPVTLELGGKSPAIALADAALGPTARRLVWGKGLNAGQTCVAPDHLLVVPEIEAPLLEAIAMEIRRLYGADPLASPDLGRVVSRPHFDRLARLVHQADGRGQVLLGGRMDAEERRIEPTLLRVDDPDHDPLMQEELFGPLLPVLRVADLEAAIARVQAGPKPLALYLFGQRPQDRERLRLATSSGSLAFNDVVVQVGVPQLPLGGVGESGMGAYHGHAGFLTFSHQRSILEQRFWPDLPFRYPPYAGKLPRVKRLMG
ncbi:MAG: aldehyde dehydrogenase family protein [Cyanobacteriota bacterium]|nr:aldehyde dehydrogenase family protein [Cyanobacteriota bacterium]